MTAILLCLSCFQGKGFKKSCRQKTGTVTKKEKGAMDMKRLMLIIVGIMFFSGCAMLQAKREVLPDNTFSCTHPSLKLKFDEKFKYKGAIKEDSGATSTNNFLKSTNATNEYFIWSNEDNDPFIIIGFSRLIESRWVWSPEHYFAKKFKNQVKIENLGGRKWHTLCYDINLSPGIKSELEKKGVRTGDKYYIKAFTGGGRTQMKISIYYFTKTKENLQQNSTDDITFMN